LIKVNVEGIVDANIYDKEAPGERDIGYCVTLNSMLTDGSEWEMGEPVEHVEETFIVGLLHSNVDGHRQDEQEGANLDG